MNIGTMIRELNAVAEKHKNDFVPTFQTNITAMCRDIIPKLEKLKEYEDLEEQGKLLRLPCKIGDILYSVSFRKKCNETKKYLINSNIECIACEFSDCACGSKEEYFIQEVKATLPTIANLIEQPKDFRVFLTREQAENALKKIEERDK